MLKLCHSVITEMIVSLIYQFKEHPMPSQHNPLELNYDFHSEECNVVFASAD